MKEWHLANETQIEHYLKMPTIVPSKNVTKFVNFIDTVRKLRGTLYLVAAGRSMDVLKIFGYRLEQEPLNIRIRYLDFLKPGIEKSDALLVLSGTGETSRVNLLIESSWDINHRIALISSICARDEYTSLFTVCKSEVRVFLPGITMDDINWKRENFGKVHPSLYELYNDTVPGPSLFEISALIFLESILSVLFFRYSKKRKRVIDYTPIERPFEKVSVIGLESVPSQKILDLKDARNKLKLLLDNKVDDEEIYQIFFKENPLAFGGIYSKIESKLPLDDKRIPDYLGTRATDGTCDIIEIKQPFLKIFRKNNKFNSKFQRCWEQVIEYLDFMKEQKHYLLSKGLEIENPICMFICGYKLNKSQLK